VITLSVIVPCYEYGRYLTDAINSLIGGLTCLGEFPPQTVGHCEIIIVDDCSTDETEDLSVALVERHSQIAYIRHRENLGTAATYNTGIEAAHGEFVTVLSADDMREPTSLEVLLRACQGTPGAVAYDDIRIFNGGQRLGARPLPGWTMEGEIRYNILHAGIMMPKAAWLEVGGYPEIMADGREEWAMGIALGLTGRPIVHQRRPGYLYREEGQNRSLHNSDWDHMAAFLCQIVGLYPDAFRDVQPRVRRGQTGRPDRFYEVVRRCLGEAEVRK
jgi:glycosyltransferase involved in cell wall biosynthesis